LGIYPVNTNPIRHKFILVQLPEPTFMLLMDKKYQKGAKEAFEAGFENIAEIGKERIRRVTRQIKEESPEYKGELGFKVFKLDTSNIKSCDESIRSKSSPVTPYLFISANLGT
jgi:adenine-specific DNA-methyltransferase